MGAGSAAAFTRPRDHPPQLPVDLDNTEAGTLIVPSLDDAKNEIVVAKEPEPVEPSVQLALIRHIDKPQILLDPLQARNVGG